MAEMRLRLVEGKSFLRTCEGLRLGMAAGCAIRQQLAEKLLARCMDSKVLTLRVREFTYECRVHFLPQVELRLTEI